MGAEDSAVREISSRQPLLPELAPGPKAFSHELEACTAVAEKDGQNVVVSPEPVELEARPGK